jgi:hypothetical protein
VQALRVWIPAAFNFSHAPPVDIGWISVLLVASHHTTLAADALRHVEVEPVLFFRLEGALRDAWNRLGSGATVRHSGCARVASRRQHERRTWLFCSFQ